MPKIEKQISVVYHNGHFIKNDQAKLSVSSLTLRYGLSIFEGIRVYRQTDDTMKPFMMKEHLQRMHLGLEMLRFPDPGIGEIPQIVDELITRNKLTNDLYVRPSIHAVNIGDIQTSPETALTVTAQSMGRKKWLSQGLKMKATIASLSRTPNSAFPSHLKCIGAYVSGYIEMRKAKDAGFDIPIFMTMNGHVSEGPTAALIIIKDGMLFRPDLSDDVLPSITANILFDLANKLGILTHSVHITYDFLLTADEIFFCGTGLEIAEVDEIDGTVIGKNSTSYHNKLIPKLTQAYFTYARNTGTRKV